MPALTIRPLTTTDHADWRALWTEYLKFYETTVPETVYSETWKRLFLESEYEPRAFIAILDGKAVGLTHYLFHRTCWSVENKCYLQDLFTDSAARGHGVGEALIDAVNQAAEARGVNGIYWLTNEANTTARRLYDRVATNTGFIRYTKT